MKPGGFVQTLLDGKRAVRAHFPHHQSMGDFMALLEQNDFQTVVPFHNGRQELYFQAAGIGSKRESG